LRILLGKIAHEVTLAKGLSPIAAKVQSVQRGRSLCQTEERGPVMAGGVPRRTAVVSPEAPESSSMAEARAGASQSQGGSRASWGPRLAHVEEQALATSRDAELARELVAREALERDVDREVVLAEQEFGSVDPVDNEEAPVADKAKSNVDAAGDLGAVLETGSLGVCMVRWGQKAVIK
jgi:hypothetical protein